ncbi:hypothetical protein D5086_022709 [Populus alba]|uniref:Uncharacterized protein n=1 Tax=Populus alba TaxID=43335 RepID=A0ACC4BGD4_POPAL
MLMAMYCLALSAACPVNFEFLNYTIITSQCKGPQYPPSSCCASFKEFACPYANLINDLTNECATIMFSYINLNGKYPPGLFSNECKDGKLGLECPAPPPSEPASDKNGRSIDDAEGVLGEFSEENMLPKNAMISGYLSEGHVDKARKMFDNTAANDAASWSALITGYIKNGMHAEALAPFQDTIVSHILPNEAALVSLLFACGQLGA